MIEDKSKGFEYDGHQFQKLYSRNDINNKVIQLAKCIDDHYLPKIQAKEVSSKITAICTLKGAFMFFSDLVKELNVEVQVEFIKPSSYIGFQSTGNVIFETFLQKQKIEGKHILIVEDIIDTGKTLQAIQAKMNEFKPASLQICTLFRRPREKHIVDVKFCGFQTHDFLIGYGLDYNQKFRDLPEVYRKAN